MNMFFSKAPSDDGSTTRRRNITSQLETDHLNNRGGTDLVNLELLKTR